MGMIFLLPVVIVILVWLFRQNWLTSFHRDNDSHYPINTDTSNSSSATEVVYQDDLPNVDCNVSDDSGDSHSGCGGDS
jgi:hypothetical protein